MKTNEQTVKDLLKRKEEYDKKKVQRRGMIRVLSAALAAVLIVLAAPAAIFTAVKLNEGPAPVPTDTAEQSPRDEEMNAASERPATPAETEPLTDAATDETGKPTSIFDIANSGSSKFDNNDYEVKIQNVGYEYNGDEIIRIPIANGLFEFRGYPYSEAMEWKFTVWAKNKPIAYIFFESNENIEILEEDLYHISLDKSESRVIRLKLKFKDDKKIGGVACYIFDEENGKIFEDKHINEGLGTEEIKEAGCEFAHVNGVVLTPIKGYVFEGRPETLIYYLAARYFGDVYESGEPLYYNDPYMEDYYNNPFCEFLRGEVGVDDPLFWLYYNDTFYKDWHPDEYRSYAQKDDVTEIMRGNEISSSLNLVSKEPSDDAENIKGDPFTNYSINV